jgi:anti-sigma factor RsiW
VEPNLTLARHAEAQDLLGAFALGAVDTEEAATVRGHLATCAACQAEMVSLWAMVDVLRETVEPLAPPPALRDRIAAVIMAERGSSPPVHAAAPATATFTAMPTMAPVERAPSRFGNSRPSGPEPPRGQPLRPSCSCFRPGY